MKSKVNFLATLLFSLLLFTASGRIFAESSYEKKSGRKMSDEEREARKERASKMLETITLWKIVDGLKLSEEQLTKFLPNYRETRDLKKEYQEKRKKIAEELESILKEKKVSSRKIGAKLTQLDKLVEEQWQKGRALQNKLKTILTPEQQAKYIFLQKQIGREMMQQLRKRMTGAKEGGKQQRQQPRKGRYSEKDFAPGE